MGTRFLEKNDRHAARERSRIGDDNSLAVGFQVVCEIALDFHLLFNVLLNIVAFCTGCSYFRHSGRVRGKQKNVKNIDMYARVGRALNASNTRSLA